MVFLSGLGILGVNVISHNMQTMELATNKSDFKFELCDGKTTYPVPSTNLALIKSAREADASLEYLGFCFGDHDHENMCPFSVQAIPDDTVVNFITLLNKGVVGSSRPKAVRFDLLKLLLDYFGAPKDLLARSLDTLRAFPHPVSALTAFMTLGFLPGGVVVDPPDVMRLDEFPLATRLAFLHKYDRHAVIPLQSMSWQHVAARLDVPLAVFPFLSPDRAVIAGGAAITLGCASARTLPSSDVDIFVLDAKGSTDLIQKLAAVLDEAKYVVCRLGKSVLTAVGYPGQTRLQIIASTATTSEELLRKFDLHVCAGYYDGKTLCSTVAAAHDWLDMKCSNGGFTSIKPKRLVKAQMKGFVLNGAARDYLKRTIGYPVSAEYMSDLNCDVPSLMPDIPLATQLDQLKRMGLTPLRTDVKLSPPISAFADLKLPPLDNSYGHTGGGGDDVFRGTVEEFLQRCTFVESPIRKRAMQILFVKPRYLIQLPVCRAAFHWSPVSNDPCAITKLIKLTIVTRADAVKFGVLLDALRDKSNFPSPVKFMDQKHQDIHVKISNDTVWYVNGIPSDSRIMMPKGTPISAVGEAAWAWGDGQVRFLLHRIHVQQDIIK